MKGLAEAEEEAERSLRSAISARLERGLESLRQKADKVSQKATKLKAKVIASAKARRATEDEREDTHAAHALGSSLVLMPARRAAEQESRRQQPAATTIRAAFPRRSGGAPLTVG